MSKSCVSFSSRKCEQIDHYVNLNRSKLINQDLFVKADGVWLNSESRYKHFFVERNSLDDWFIVRDFHWRLPDHPIPQGRHKMSRQKALAHWNSLKATGWKVSPSPMRHVYESSG